MGKKLLLVPVVALGTLVLALSFVACKVGHEVRGQYVRAFQQGRVRGNQDQEEKSNYDACSDSMNPG